MSFLRPFWKGALLISIHNMRLFFFCFRVMTNIVYACLAKIVFARAVTKKYPFLDRCVNVMFIKESAG